jgi:hypothetical protein
VTKVGIDNSSFDCAGSSRTQVFVKGPTKIVIALLWNNAFIVPI